MLRSCSPGFCWKHVQTNTKQPDPAHWGVEAMVCSWSIFKNSSLVIVYFIHMLTGILKRGAGTLVLAKWMRLQATLVPDLRGRGNPIGCSASFNSARRQQRKVTRSFKGHSDVFSRSPMQWIKTESELWVAVPLFWQPITRRLPREGRDCSFADSQRYADLFF